MTDAEAPASDGDDAEGRPLRAALWMMGAVISFTFMAVAGRELSKELDTFEIMMWRSGLGMPIVTLWLWVSLGPRGFIPKRFGLYTTRNVIHFAAQNCWFYGIATIPLAQLVALEFTSPVWVALLAPLLLAERLTAAKLLAAGLGFAGVLVIAQPGAAVLSLGHAAGLGAAIGFALTNILTRRLSRVQSGAQILFWMTTMQTAFAIILAAPGGVAIPSAELAPWTVAIAVVGFTAHLSLTKALTLAPASVVAPMEFARLPVIATLGLALYGEPLEWALAAGAALILGANALNIQASRKSRA